MTADRREYLRQWKLANIPGYKPRTITDEHPADEGCSYHTKCITCPYPVCITEELSWKEAEKVALTS